MNYENPKIPEGINVTDVHPLKDFFVLLIGVGVAVLALVAVLSLAAGWLAHKIPFELEKKLAQSAFAEAFVEEAASESTVSSEHQKIEQYLQGLANELALAQQLPAGMDITVHYIDGDVVNAFATLGGNIVLYRGIIEKAAQ